MRNLTLITLLLAFLLPSCDRKGKDPKDKLDEIPRGTGGTPATQTAPTTNPTPR